MVELLRKGAKKRELAQVATLPRAIHDVQRQKPSTAVPHGQGEEGAMTSTNEDVVVLATAPSDDGKQLLVVRHLPDRGTIEIGWWARESGAIAPPPSVLELAAEAVEIDAVMRLCATLFTEVTWETAGDGRTLAETPPDADGARIAAVRSKAGVTLVRDPEGGELVLSSHAALGLLVRIFPAARLKLTELGFGLVQQGDPACGPAVGQT
jgi:hypothetical protein